MAKRRTSKRPFTPEDIRRIHFVSDPMVHPDGDRIAYVVRKVDPDLEQNRYRAEIQLVCRSG